MSGRKFIDGGSVGELVVAGGEESFDGLGAEHALELLGEPGGGGPQGELLVDGEWSVGHDACRVEFVRNDEIGRRDVGNRNTRERDGDQRADHLDRR